jgi:hypothetical protein
VTPRAYGVAPVSVLEGGELVAGIPPGEAVWLGFQAIDRSRPAVVRVRMDGEPEQQLVCPPDHALPGVRRDAGFMPFSEGRLTVIVDGDDSTQVAIRLVSADEFAGMTGVSVEPIDPSSGFGDHRLP